MSNREEEEVRLYCNTCGSTQFRVGTTGFLIDSVLQGFGPRAPQSGPELEAFLIEQSQLSPAEAARRFVEDSQANSSWYVDTQVTSRDGYNS